MLFSAINFRAKRSNSTDENSNLILRNRAPSSNRRQCCCHRKHCPFTTRTASNSPSPYRKPRSNADTTALSSATNLPLRNTFTKDVPAALTQFRRQQILQL